MNQPQSNNNSANEPEANAPKPKHFIYHIKADDKMPHDQKIMVSLGDDNSFTITSDLREEIRYNFSGNEDMLAPRTLQTNGDKGPRTVTISLEHPNHSSNFRMSVGKKIIGLGDMQILSAEQMEVEKRESASPAPTGGFQKYTPSKSIYAIREEKSTSQGVMGQFVEHDCQFAIQKVGGSSHLTGISNKHSFQFKIADNDSYETVLPRTPFAIPLESIDLNSLQLVGDKGTPIPVKFKSPAMQLV